MTEKPQTGTIALCPCCSSTIPHHWPDGCISLLEAHVATLQEQLALAREEYEETAASAIRKAGLGARHV